MRRAIAASIAMLPLLAPAGAPAAKPAPAPAPTGIATFARHPQFLDARLSPTGKYLAVIAVEGGRRSLVFMDLATRQFVWAQKPDRDTMIGDFHWVNDERVLAELVDQDGDLAAPVSRGELYAVNATGKNGMKVYGYRSGNAEKAWAFVLDTLPNDRRRVLIETRRWDEVGDRYPQVYRLDVYSGMQQHVTAAPVPEAGFLTDENGEPRIAAARDKNVKLGVFYRDPGGSWRALEGVQGLGPEPDPVGFVGRDRTLYAIGKSPRGFGLFAVPVDGGRPRLLAENAIVPPSSFVVDRATHRIVAVEFEPDLPVYEFVDPEHPLSRMLRGLLETFPAEHVCLLSTTDDQKRAVVKVFGDRNPGRLLLVDVEKLTAEPIADLRPWIRSDEMAGTNSFHIDASDGFRIHGYVTLPRAASPGAPPPLVVVPHGGPHFARDSWGFDPTVQLLAAQGFAVLQVNFRGSGGYGIAYREAGYRRWGDRVVQDVVDATRFAIRKGFGDPGRVCAFGASFGAYAAVQAAILAPDLFRCAVGYAGVYDLTRLGSTDEVVVSRLGRRFVKTTVGEDETALRRASPVYSAEKIRARVLLVHGRKDRRAPIEHAEKLRKALERTGNAPEWLVEPKEGHGFYDEGARERMYTRVVAFLRENTAPRPGAAPPSTAAARAGGAAGSGTMPTSSVVPAR